MAVPRRRTQSRTAERIIDVAERLVQTRGFNNFSYADIATELRITTASLHYHFPSKAELGSALTARHAEQFAAALGQIDQHMAEPRAKLEAFTRLYEDVLRRERMCMCGILAAEYETLPKPMRSAVLRFFEENQRWLEDVLTQGRADKSLSFTPSADEIAQRILSTLEGAMLVARPDADLNRFNATAQQLLASVTA